MQKHEIASKFSNQFRLRLPRLLGSFSTLPPAAAGSVCFCGRVSSSSWLLLLLAVVVVVYAQISPPSALASHRRAVIESRGLIGVRAVVLVIWLPALCCSKPHPAAYSAALPLACSQPNVSPEVMGADSPGAAGTSRTGPTSRSAPHFLIESIERALICALG